MKSFTILLAGYLGWATASSIPFPEQLPFQIPDSPTDVIASLQHLVQDTISALNPIRDTKITWDDDQSYTIVTHPSYPLHSLRFKQPQLCDPDVVQYSGYLDINDEKHFFFWFFESRDKPESDPLVMWLNGGPGCSSFTGLLFELGPCSISANGNGTTYNPHSWNSNANMIFLDQPVNVGYSFTEGSGVNNSEDSAKDVYAFLQLFYKQFNQYKKLKFSVAAESYGGHYVPNIGNYIWKQNLAVQSTPSSSAKLIFEIPLESLLIGNGVTDPLIQSASVPDYACPPSKYSVYDETTCTSMKSKLSTCSRLQSSCYSSGSRFACVGAMIYCTNMAYGPLQTTGLNPYDIRKKCDRNGEDGPLCYKEMELIETYLNQDAIKSALGVPSSIKFQSCNMQVNQNFALAGDGMHNSAAKLIPLLEDGVRVLIYAGEYDYMCNFLGNKQWVLALNTTFQDEINSSPLRKFLTTDGTHGGEIISAGSGAGNFTFVKIFDAGHMVPFDQPIVSLEMFNKWLKNEKL